MFAQLLLELASSLCDGLLDPLKETTKEVMHLVGFPFVLGHFPLIRTPTTMNHLAGLVICTVEDRMDEILNIERAVEALNR